jgi:hypothetical protein
MEPWRNTNIAIARNVREKRAEKSVTYQYVNMIEVTEEIVEKTK